MSTQACARAISDAITGRSAFLKIISANDAGATGSHQAGLYLPKRAQGMFTPHRPIAGRRDKHELRITWPDGIERESVVTWYGEKTRDEYRLTRFGRDFPFLGKDSVGELLVLIPAGPAAFIAHLLKLEEEIEDIQAALGVEILGSWAIYGGDEAERTQPEDECVATAFGAYAGTLEEFPTGSEMSRRAASTLEQCVKGFSTKLADERLMRCVAAEYELFRSIEGRLCGDAIKGPFPTVESLIGTAATIMNRRKSRAGRSLENHVERVLREEGVPLEMRPRIQGSPDVVIPGKAAYDDPSYPLEKLFVVGVKTTCKDRWGQVTKEARRASHKYILTLQAGIATGQLREMHEAHVSLIVPSALHKKYPKGSGIEMLSIDGFASRVRSALKA